MNVEQAAAEALLDKGVSVPFKKLPFVRKPLRVTLRRPRMGGLIQLALYYLRIGVTHDQLMNFTPEQEMEFLALHGKTVSRMIALTVCRGYFSRKWLSPLAAFVIRECVDHDKIMAAYREYVTLLGVKSFSTIIRSAEVMNPMKPMLSHEKKRS